MKNRVISSLLVVVLLVSLIVGVVGCGSVAASPLSPQQRLRVATTTSLYDTGLWGYLEPMFEEQYNVELDIISAGTGKALEFGKRGDIDVITVHSRTREEQFIAEGYGIARVPFAYNYFLIVGPEADPADIKSMNPEEAFQRLSDTGSGSFVSRGDDSGTHGKEKTIWAAASYDYEAIREAEWYIEAGAGMGPVLMMTSEKQAYTLTDMGTFLAYKGKIDLVPIVDSGDMLLNVYSAIAINPDMHSEVKAEMAGNLIDFLNSPEIQEFIGIYGVEEYGMQLFIPCAGAEPK